MKADGNGHDGRAMAPFASLEEHAAVYAAVVGLAQTQGGQLRLCPSPLGGAGFELTLPMASGWAEPAVADSPAAVADVPGRRAVIVDDEPEVAVLLAEALRKIGYLCDVASGGREAQALIAARSGAYDAVVCDVRMPDIDGPALFAWLETHHPALALRTLFVTGDALGPAAGRFLAHSHRPVLEKPFLPADVARLVAGFAPWPGAPVQQPDSAGSRLKQLKHDCPCGDIGAKHAV